METQIEIYDMLESISGIMNEPDAESIYLIDELGLDGQKKLNENSDKGNRNPYGKMTADQAFACQILFPKMTIIESFSDSPIPYRVLKEAKAAKEHFEELYVLHQAPAELKDPVLVGSLKKIENWRRDSDIYPECFLIARWGDALDSWESLYNRAVRKFVSEKNEQLEILVARLQSFIAHPAGIRFSRRFTADECMRHVFESRNNLF